MTWLQQNWQGLAPWVMFVLLYVLTFRLAWRKLADLVVASVTKRHGVISWQFWWKFIEYRLILIAPYVPFVIFKQHVPTTVNKLLFWWVALMFVMGVLRFVGTNRMTRILWWIYAYMYDGLLNFYPYRNLVRVVVDRMELKDEMSLLELGCGTGNVVAAAIECANVKVVAVDNSKAMLRQAKKKLRHKIKSGQVEVVHKDALEYLRSMPDKAFDRISMVNFLYTVPDRTAIWQECIRLLKPYGRIVTTTSTEGGSRPIIQEHLRNSSWLELVSLRLVGVVIVDFFISELAKAGPFHFPKQEQLLLEVESAGGVASQVNRVYGGPDEGVNIVFNVKKLNRIYD